VWDASHRKEGNTMGTATNKLGKTRVTTTMLASALAETNAKLDALIDKMVSAPGVAPIVAPVAKPVAREAKAAALKDYMYIEDNDVLVIKIQLHKRGERNGSCEFISQSNPFGKALCFTVTDEGKLIVSPRSQGMVTEYGLKFNLFAFLDPNTGSRIDGVR